MTIFLEKHQDKPKEVMIKTTWGGAFPVTTTGKYILPMDEGKVYSLNALDESGIWLLAAEVRRRIDHLYDCAIIITGEPRNGKSTIAVKLARVVYPGFKLDDVHFNLNSFLDHINTMEPAHPGKGYYPTVLFDEAGTGLFAQEWWDELQRTTVKTFQVVGKKNIVSIFVLPHRDDLNKRLREGRVKWWVHVHERGVAEVHLGLSNKWHQKSYWTSQYMIDFKAEEGEFWDNYEKKKDAFIDDFTKRKEGKVGLRELAYKKKLIQAISKAKSSGKTQDEVAELFGIDQAQVSKYLKELESLPENE